ncbi:hypothetical protein P691DRAFT_279948 [Macrolepiota fuliginosa MF-IS2]|uniref:Uncharacterized protein n=1 Tax=Macrolepiota fuliginosa MF-IS2 TaxID=1400762 RepID=A0A9P6C183_9AGAR|nr:hypothetical protein P691DRAFT_279948 [Macrolepiota fuliginosa MF-IS2]
MQGRARRIDSSWTSCQNWSYTASRIFRQYLSGKQRSLLGAHWSVTPGTVVLLLERQRGFFIIYKGTRNQIIKTPLVGYIKQVGYPGVWTLGFVNRNNTLECIFRRSSWKPHSKSKKIKTDPSLLSGYVRDPRHKSSRTMNKPFQCPAHPIFLQSYIGWFL